MQIIHHGFDEKVHKYKTDPQFYTYELYEQEVAIRMAYRDLGFDYHGEYNLVKEFGYILWEVASSTSSSPSTQLRDCLLNKLPVAIKYYDSKTSNKTIEEDCYVTTFLNLTLKGLFKRDDMKYEEFMYIYDHTPSFLLKQNDLMEIAKKKYDDSNGEITVHSEILAELADLF